MKHVPAPLDLEAGDFDEEQERPVVLLSVRDTQRNDAYPNRRRLDPVLCVALDLTPRDSLALLRLLDRAVEHFDTADPASRDDSCLTLRSPFVFQLDAYTSLPEAPGAGPCELSTLIEDSAFSESAVTLGADRKGLLRGEVAEDMEWELRAWTDGLRLYGRGPTIQSMMGCDIDRVDLYRHLLYFARPRAVPPIVDRLLEADPSYGLEVLEAGEVTVDLGRKPCRRLDVELTGRQLTRLLAHEDLSVREQALAAAGRLPVERDVAAGPGGRRR